MLAAVAGLTGQLARVGHRQRVVAPLSGAVVGPVVGATTDRDACPGAAAEDDREDDVEAGARAVAGLGRRQAVSIVLDADLAAQSRPEVCLDGPAQQPRGVGALAQAGTRLERARDADADAAPLPGSRLETRHELGDEPGYRRHSRLAGVSSRSRASSSPASDIAMPSTFVPPQSIPMSIPVLTPGSSPSRG